MSGSGKDGFKNRNSTDKIQSAGLSTHRQGGADLGPGWVSENSGKLILIVIVLIVIVLALMIRNDSSGA
jgi:hypothetical protein